MPDESWQVVLLRPARTYLGRLPLDEREGVLNALASLITGPNPDLKRPPGRPEWSLRLGGKRLLLIPDTARKLLVVVRYGPGAEVYK